MSLSLTTRNFLGGTLSHPFERFPTTFGSFDLFQRYPYLLREYSAVYVTDASLPRHECYHLYRDHLRCMLLQGDAAEANTPAALFRRVVHLRSGDPRRLRAREGELGLPGSDAVSTSSGHLRDNVPQRVGRRRESWLTLSFVSGGWQAASLLFFFDKNK